MNGRILAYKRRGFGRLLRYSAGEIATKLSESSVQRVRSFGSYAKNRSDIFTESHVLVIMETDEPFVERIGEIPQSS